MAISNRLLQVSSYVRNGSITADIGTDHAYLPIYLVQNGICDTVIASDINFSPCQRAIENVELHNLSDKIKVIQTDGLCGITKYHPIDIIIAGMGGELIWEIISVCDYVKNSNIRLILQPMTKIPDLRKLLILNGFDIIDESYAEEDRRIYEILCVSYSGYTQVYDDIELLIGKKNVEKRDELLYKMIDKKINSLEKIIRSMKNADIDTSKELELLKKLRSLL